MTGWEILGIWSAALLTLAIFSFLYRDNPVYRFAEHLLVGVSAGYYLYQYCFTALYRNLWVPVIDEGQIIQIFGGLLGGLMLLRFSRRTEWISRFALAFYVGAGAGYTIPNIMNAQVLEQIQGTFLSPAGSVSLWSSVKEILILVGVISIIVYFFFSREHKGVFGSVSRVGITFLMVGFGASFGYTVMGRITLLIGRVQFLLQDWPQAFP